MKNSSKLCETIGHQFTDKIVTNNDGYTLTCKRCGEKVFRNNYKINFMGKEITDRELVAFIIGVFYVLIILMIVRTLWIIK